LAMSVPGFWVSIMLIYFVAVNHRWLPTGGYIPFTENPLANLRYLILPAGTLGVLTAAPIMRYLRSSLVEELRQDYIVTARSKGLTEYKVVFRHAVRNALIPTVTIVALQFGSSLIGGVVVMEYVFHWQGIGTQLVDAVFNRDYFVLQSICLLVAVSVVILNLAVDILYTFIDPRIVYV
jgi:peptide/nickel transport system permease protein